MEKRIAIMTGLVSNGIEKMGGVGVQRNGRPIIKLARMNGVAP